MIQQILAQEDSVVELSDCRGVNLREPQRTQRTQSMAFAPQLGLPALGRFPQFSAFDEVGETLTEVEAENSRNRPNMAFSRSSLSRSRSFSTCNRQQDTLGPLIIRRRQNAETRDRILVVLLELCNLHNPSV